MIVGMTAITFLIRYAMFATAGRFALPEVVTRTLRYVPPAVLSAIILPAVLIPDEKTLHISLSSPHLVGAVAALAVGLLTRNILAVIITGMAVFWLWQAPFLRSLLPM
jgi:branched-subunit amino acid transport protein